jgi:DNA invertase Pin-like site-specific DNA recombinase
MRVGIYCRLSEEDRDKQNKHDDSRSIQNQKTMLIQYATEQGWEIYNIYSDDDYTGSDRNRPQFKKLLVDAENRKFDIVLCKTQSRFTRELELIEKYLHHLFPIWNIRFVSIVDNADTENKGNKKSRQIYGLVNEWYLEDMSENIRSVFESKQRAGYHIGSFALYGYKKDPNKKGHLIIDEEAAKIVREVFTLFSQGHGKTAIARLLNDRGIPNPTEYKRQHGLRYRQSKSDISKLWKYFAISDMLINEMYIGNMVQRRFGSVSYKTKTTKSKPKEEWQIIKGTHDPIISPELWNSVQELVKQKVKPFTIGTIGLFSRKAYCKNCGYTLTSSKNNNKHYLKCPNRHISQSACIGSFTSVDYLERTIIKEINRFSEVYLDKSELAKSVNIFSDFEKQKEEIQLNIHTYAKKIEELNNGIKTLYLDKVKGVISDSEYIEFTNDFKIEKSKFEKNLKEKENSLEQVEEKLNTIVDRKQIIEQYTNLEKLNREIVEKLIDKIYVDKRIAGTRTVPVEIYWKF